MPNSFAPAAEAAVVPAGLTRDEARRLLAEHGPNEILDREKHSFWRTLRDVF